MPQIDDPETFPVTSMPAVSTDQGVTVTTHNGRVRWVIAPRNPELPPGHSLPEVLYGDIISLVIDGQQRCNNRTYAKLEKAGRLTISARPLEPTTRGN